MMENILKNIKHILPCRDKIISELFDLIGDPEDSYPNAIYLYGHTGTGKTSIITEILSQCGSKFVILNCIECYTSKILYETIINSLYSDEHSPLKKCSPQTKRKCENLKDFINELRNLLDEKRDTSYVICLDNAERTRNMDANILPAFIRLQELTGLNICCIMISQLPFEKFYPKTGLSEVIVICCQQYSKIEIQKILSKDFEIVKKFVASKVHSKLSSLNSQNDNDEYDKKLKILENLEDGFYENYLNIFLNVFYRACRDLPELRMISRDCFNIYCEPVLSESIDCNDVSKLWRHIALPLRTALSAVYMRIDHNLETKITFVDGGNFESNQSIKKMAQSLELPYYAKFLLIASFIASHNAPKDDKRLFVKNSGKTKKRIQTINANAKVTEKMSTSLGPKSFTIDRLLAIFYAILEEKVGLTCNLLAQISSLVHLKFLTYVSGANNVMEGSARLQCTVGLDFIIHIGKVVGFNVRQYLCDFM